MSICSIVVNLVLEKLTQIHKADPYIHKADPYTNKADLIRYYIIFWGSSETTGSSLMELGHSGHKGGQSLVFGIIPEITTGKAHD